LLKYQVSLLYCIYGSAFIYEKYVLLSLNKPKALGRMTIGRMPLGRMTLGRIPLGRMTLGRMMLGRMTIGRMMLGRMPF
jgi:hypothetical protein